MSLTRLFVERPTLVTVFLALVLLGGHRRRRRRSCKQQFPNTDVPSIQVLVSYPGASTTEMRDAIVRPLEDQIAGAPNLDHIETAIQPGQASIVARLRARAPTRTTISCRCKGACRTRSAQLPNDVQTPQISIYDPSEAVVVSLVAALARRSRPATSPRSSINKIVPSLEQIAGRLVRRRKTARSRRRSKSTSTRKRSASSGFTLTDVVSTITNNNVRAPGGIALLAEPRDEPRRARRHSRRPDASPTCCSARRRRRGAGDDQRRGRRRRACFRIGDVANVTDTLRDAARLRVLERRRRASTLDIQKSAGTSEVETSQARARRAARARSGTYPDVQFTVLNVQSTYTRAAALGRRAHADRGDRLHRHRDALLPALVAQRDRRDDRDPGLAARHARRRCSWRTSRSTPSRCWR